MRFLLLFALLLMTIVAGTLDGAEQINPQETPEAGATTPQYIPILDPVIKIFEGSATTADDDTATTNSTTDDPTTVQPPAIETTLGPSPTTETSTTEDPITPTETMTTEPTPAPTPSPPLPPIITDTPPEKPTTTPTTTEPPTTTQPSTTTTTAGIGAMSGSDSNIAVYSIVGAIIFLIIVGIVVFLIVRSRKNKKKGGDPQKKSKSKSRTPSTRNTTDTSQQVTRPLIPPSNASERPSKGGVPPPPTAGLISTPGSTPSNPSNVPLMRDNNETPTGLIPSQNGPFIPGEQPFKIPAKHFKWMGPMRRKTRWHGDPDHEFEGVEGPKKLDRIYFDPNANTATEIGPCEIIEDAGPASDSNRSGKEWLNNLDEWERNHKATVAAAAAEAAAKANGKEDGKKEEGKNETDSKQDPKPPATP